MAPPRQLLQQWLQPANGATPGFRAHLKHPLPELPRIAIGGWALSLYVLIAMIGGVLHRNMESSQGVLPVSLLLWLLAALGMCFMVWLNPWPVLAMRRPHDFSSALGDCLGMAYAGLLAFLPLLIILPNHVDYRGRIRMNELVVQSSLEREQIAEQLLAHKAIAPKQMPLSARAGEQAWLGVESDGRVWLYRSDVRALLWLTPKATADGMRWQCQGLGKRAHLPSPCRDHESAPIR